MPDDAPIMVPIKLKDGRQVSLGFRSQPSPDEVDDAAETYESLHPAKDQSLVPVSHHVYTPNPHDVPGNTLEERMAARNARTRARKSFDPTTSSTSPSLDPGFNESVKRAKDAQAIQKGAQQEESHPDDLMSRMYQHPNPKVRQAAAKVDEAQANAVTPRDVVDSISQLGGATSAAIAGGLATAIRSTYIPGIDTGAIADALHKEGEGENSPLAKTISTLNPETYLAMGMGALATPREFFTGVGKSVLKVVNKAGSTAARAMGNPVEGQFEDPTVDDYFTTAMVLGAAHGGIKGGIKAIANLKESYGDPFGDIATRGFEGGADSMGNRDAHVRGSVTEPPKLEVPTPEPTATGGKSRGKQSGAASADVLTLGVKPLIEQDIAPGTVKAVKGVGKIVADLKKTLSPESVTTVIDGVKTDIAGKAARTIRGITGRASADALHFQTVTSPLVKQFAKLPEKAQLEFSDAIGKGDAQPNPELQEAADLARKMLDEERANLLQAAKGFDLKLAKRIEAEWQENYFPRVYEVNPEVADILSRSVSTKRPLTGRKTFLKKRTIEDAAASRAANEAAGRKLVTTNPFEMIQLHHAQMSKYISGMQAMAEWKKTPLHPGSTDTVVKFFKVKPEGWTQINDAIAEVRAPNTAEGARAVRGHYYAPDDAARVINNWMGPGLRGNAVFDAINTANNAAVQVSFGVSAFHAVTTSMNAIVSDLALGAGKLTSRSASPKVRISGLADIATAGAAPVKAFVKGSQAIADVKTGMEPAAVKALEDGGFKFKLDSAYETKMTANMLHAFQHGNPLGGALRVPGSVFEQAGNVIMKQIVPRIKAGAALDLARLEMHEMEQMGVEINSDRYRKVMASAVDTVENRFGQLARDNLFMDNRIKDGLQQITMFGWNLGTLREPLGAVKDTLTARSRLAEGDNLLTRRMLGTAIVPVTAAITGGIYHYLHTGKAPESLEDVFHPKTGRVIDPPKDSKGKVVKGPDGKPLAPYEERVDLPGYMRDYMAWASDPVKTLAGKASPGIQDVVAGVKTAQNQDWRGDPIVYHKQDAMDKFKAVGLHLLKQIQPISVQGSQKARDDEAIIESFFGVRIKSRPMSAAEQDKVEGMHKMKIAKQIEADQEGYEKPAKKARGGVNVHIPSARVKVKL